MNSQTVDDLRNFPVWSSVILWLTAFVSPTVYFLAVIALASLQLPRQPEWFGGVIIALFCLVPVAALIFCSIVAWRSQVSRGWRIGWLALTMLGILLQFGALVIIIVSWITVAISPA